MRAAIRRHRHTSFVIVVQVILWTLLSSHASVILGQTLSQYTVMYGHSDNVGTTAAFRDHVVPYFSVIEGTSSNSGFINELRNQGKVYAAHVINPTTETAAQLLDRWRAPFDNTLGGQLSGGYDAIAIDELHGASTNGTANSNAVVSALQQLRALYPNKGIYAATTWQYGQNSANHTDQLNALDQYADLVMVENYNREGNYHTNFFSSYADNLKSAVPGILNKTVYGLYIPQGGFVADDSTNTGFFGMLDDQFHRLRNDADAATMPGVMFWPYYRTEKDLTPQYVSQLVDHYYIQGNTGFFGDGTMEQLVTNPQFEGNTNGWSLAQGSGGSIQTFNYSSVSFQSDHDNFGLASHGSSGLKMVRGSSPNEASFQISGVDPNMVYEVSAFVISGAANQRATLSVTEPDGTVIESEAISDVGSPPDFYHKWNEWSRLDFDFVPTTDTINVVLGDANASFGTELYWDFVELEAAYAVPIPPNQFEWAAATGGSWSTASNWSPAGVPDGNQVEVTFGQLASSTAAITVSPSVTVKTLRFDRNLLYLLHSGQITLDADTGNGLIDVANGSHNISSPLHLAGNIDVQTASGTELILNGLLELNGHKLFKSGGGTLAINGSFGFAGGTLQAQGGVIYGNGSLGGHFNNVSSTVAPGNGTGVLTVEGFFTQFSSGTLQMEIGGTTAGFDHDQLVASGIQFGGDLEILLVDGFIPSGGDEFDLFESVSSSGNFTSIQLPAGIDWDTSSLLTAGILSVANPFVLDGDYNGTGIVNIFDLNLALFDWDQDGANLSTLWIQQRPGPGETVGLAQLNAVLFNWGATAPLTAVIPEPTSALLLLVSVSSLAIRYRLQRPIRS